MGKIVRELTLDGISIKVVSNDKSFDVYVKIKKGAILNKKRKSKQCEIQFRGAVRRNVAKGEIQIKFENVRYNKRNLEEVFERTFILDRIIEGKIYISPDFYLSEYLLKKCKEQREQEHEKLCERLVQAERNAGNRKQKDNRYPYTNLFKPYQGGSCSPK